MTIPTLHGAPAYDGSNGTASAIVIPITYTDGSGNPLVDWGGGISPTGGNNFTGSLVYDGTLYLTGAIGFDSAFPPPQTAWIMSAATNLANAGFGTPNGASTFNNTYPRLFSASMGIVPAIWQRFLGGPAYVIGGNGFSVVSRTSNGFGFSTFDPATVFSGGGSVTLTELQNYYYDGLFTSANATEVSARSLSGPFPLTWQPRLSGYFSLGADNRSYHCNS